MVEAVTRYAIGFLLAGLAYGQGPLVYSGCERGRRRSTGAAGGKLTGTYPIRVWRCFRATSRNNAANTSGNANTSSARCAADAMLDGLRSHRHSGEREFDGCAVVVSRIKTIDYTFDGNGLGLSAGRTGYKTVPFACASFTSWNISVDSGTATVKIWKIATGTAIPTVSNSINTSGVAISTGTSVHSTTLTDFTATTSAAYDIWASICWLSMALPMSALPGVFALKLPASRALGAFLLCGDHPDHKGGIENAGTRQHGGGHRYRIGGNIRGCEYSKCRCGLHAAVPRGVTSIVDTNGDIFIPFWTAERYQSWWHILRRSSIYYSIRRRRKYDHDSHVSGTGRRRCFLWRDFVVELGRTYPRGLSTNLRRHARERHRPIPRQPRQETSSRPMNS